MTTKTTSKPTVKTTKRARKSQAVGESIIQGLKEAIAWNKGANDAVRVTLVHVPTKFGFPPATLRNWEQGRSHPDTPTRVLLAVIAKHPDAVEDVLRKAS